MNKLFERGSMTPRRRPPRHFLYLDREIAESYLSDLIGWLPEEASTTDITKGAENRDTRLGTRGTYISRGGNDEVSSEDTWKSRYTPAALFDHLYRELDREVDGARMLVHLESLDESGWQDLQNGDLVEITGTLKVPDVLKAIEMARGLGQLMPIMESLGASGQIHMTEEDKVMLGGLSMLSQLGESAENQSNPVVIVEMAMAPSYRFVTNLKREFLRTEDFEGEVKVLGKVQRKVNQGDPPIGLEQLVPALKSFKGLQDFAPNAKSEPTDQDIGYPAATLTPIGIYQ